MKQLRLPLFTSKIKYYSLRIVPPEPVFNRVTEIKNLFEFAYGKQPLSRSKPYIPLANFVMNSRDRDLLVEVFERLSARESFKVHINGFGIFLTSNTLYLKVAKNPAIEAIHEHVQSLRNDSYDLKLKSFTVSENPHVTISKASGSRMLNESLRYFQENPYSTEITVDRLTLVSRSKYKPWDWKHEIKLAPTG